MKNITTITSPKSLPELAKWCETNNITFFDNVESEYFDVITDGKVNKELLIICRLEDLGSNSTSELLKRGYKIGTFREEDRHFFEGLPDMGLNIRQVCIGVINLSTGETIDWEIPDTYEQDRARWVEKHSGQICSSCGSEMNEDRDFSHGCSETICYMCS